jgi:ubiquinone/menaquinone biosynthesis C-methylase UbiE
MSEDLYEDGFQNQVNVDFSPVVIKAMQEKHKDKPGMQFKKMDLRDMDFPDCVFDAVLDKATIDSILCAEGALPLASKCLGEISRVLQAKGVFACISHGHPNTRMSILDRPEYGWTVSVQNVPKPMLKLMKDHMLPEGNGEGEERVYHYVYICVKK